VVVQLGERTRAVLVDVEHGCKRAAVRHGETGADVARRRCADGEGKVEQALHLLLPPASAVQHRRAPRAARRVSRHLTRQRARLRCVRLRHTRSACPVLSKRPSVAQQKQHHAGEMDKDGI
jgi:hypothetical protein